MTRNLPPLNSLRAFEAAGRHLSFSRAADELHVTPAAVSHQVKHLEDWLGVPLFRRLPRGLLLTDAGQICLPQIGESFDGLAAAVGKARSLKDDTVLTVSVMPSLAARKLLPALPRFQSLHPDIDLHLLTTTRSVDLARDGIDLAIRYGRGDWPGLHAELLRTEVLFPVCSPALLEGAHPLGTPDDLRHHTLLHDLFWKNNFVGAFPDWATWLKTVGIDDIDPGHGLALTPSDMVFQAAIAGQGVALGRSVLVEDDLAAGRLVQPFGPTIALDWSYYLVSSRTAGDRPKVAALRQWVREAVGER